MSQLLTLDMAQRLFPGDPRTDQRLGVGVVNHKLPGAAAGGRDQVDRAIADVQVRHLGAARLRLNVRGHQR